MRFDLHTKTFNPPDNLPDANGTYWYITDWDGWDSPPMRQTVVAPTSRHGTVMAQSLLDQRAILLRGVVKAPTETTFWTAWYELNGIVNNIYEAHSLRVYEGSNIKQMDVIRGGDVRMKIIGVNSFTFEIPLLAIDPLKYSNTSVLATLIAGETKNITNAGTFPTEQIVATMSANGRMQLKNTDTNEYVGTAGATSLTYNPTIRTVKSGTVFDFYARTALDPSGLNVYDALSASSMWFALQPGVNHIKNEGNTTVTLRHYSAWI